MVARAATAAMTGHSCRVVCTPALGADRRSILSLIVGTAMRLAFVGAAIGCLAAWWLSGLLQSEFTDIDPGDPVTFAVVALTMLVVALLAAGLPAWRAARLDPADALRAD